MTRRRLGYLLYAVLFLFSAALLAQAPAPIPVTGHFGGIGPESPNNYGVRFELEYCGANLPRVFGYFNPVKTNTVLPVNSTNGLLSGTIWPNDEISCGGVVGGTRYNITPIVDNVPQGLPTCYQVLASVGTFNLDTAQPCTTVPPPPPPPGMGDYEFHNLTLSGLLQGTSAIFTGDVTALSFHFSTAGAHYTCPAGQAASALLQDFTFSCIPVATSPPTFNGHAPVSNNYVPTSGDYSFSMISGLLADSAFQANTHTYPIHVQEADQLTNNPGEATCGLTAGQAISSITIDAGANLACGHIALPAPATTRAIHVTTQCSGGSNDCICTSTSTSYDECSVNLGFTAADSYPQAALPTAFDSATCSATPSPINAGPSNNGAVTCFIVGGNTAGVTVMLQGLRSLSPVVTDLWVNVLGH